MAQANLLTTASREVLSRELPPKSTIPVRAAHAKFIAALDGNTPHSFHPTPDSHDIEERADHLEKVFGALQGYVAAVISETAQSICAGTGQFRDLDKLLRDVLCEVVDAIQASAEDMRQHETWRAP